MEKRGPNGKCENLGSVFASSKRERERESYRWKLKREIKRKMMRTVWLQYLAIYDNEKLPKGTIVL